MNFSVNINAPAAKVWKVLFDDVTYRAWTSVFTPGSYAETDWQKGSRVRFLDPKGNGMYSKITDMIPDRLMEITHEGEIVGNVDQPAAGEQSPWYGSREIYRLSENNGVTTLDVELTGEMPAEEKDHMTDAFRKGLDIVKDLSENPVRITVSTTVSQPVDKVWKCWNTPDDVRQWNAASEDWHTPAASNDLKPGGRFVYRMEAKDGSFGFDFGGTYTQIDENKLIRFRMDDGREVVVEFSTEPEGTVITETFDAEDQNSFEMQQMGWQAILDNFKKYAENS